MIFPRESISLIRQRQRGELRLPVRRHPQFGFEVPCRFKVGEVYAAQTTRKWTVERLREHAKLCEEEAANRARAVLLYLDEPIEAHHPKATVVNLGFQVTVMDVRRDGDRWVIRFEVGDHRYKFDRNVFMAAVIGPNPVFGRNEQDYTDKPGFALDRDAPVPPAVLDRFAAAAGSRDDLRRREEAHRARIQARWRRS